MSIRIISTGSIEGRLYASSGVQVPVHPIKIEHAVDLPDQMIRRHDLVEIERVEKLTLSALSPPHHRPLPANRNPGPRNHGSTAVSTRVLQHNRGESRHAANMAKPTRLDPKQTSVGN